tara:strand:+ start:120 stop:299 length:180 start_codon:yes stop_codon:yes gene_type:complete
MEPTIIIFFGIMVFGLSFKYLTNNCKAPQDDILFITDSINNQNNQNSEVPPKYEDIYNN